MNGSVLVPGAKNAALKEIAASLLTDERCVLENVPQITDVVRMLALLQRMGVEVEEDASAHRVAITARVVDATKIADDEVRAFRASIVLLGPLLVRCGEVRLPYPGGDLIGARPITAHLRALEQFGAEIQADGKTIHAKIPAGGLRPGRIIIPGFFVTATENALLVASSLQGTSTVEIAALEPHVRDLGALLTAMGATVELHGPHTYVVSGQPRLSGATHRIIGDSLDAFIFLSAGIATRGTVTVSGVNPEELTLPLEKLKEMGIVVDVGAETLHVASLPSVLQPTAIQAMPYPGVPSDLQPLFAILATQAHGTSLIHDPLYENRFRYIEELNRMGANASLLDPHRVMVSGPTPLTGVPISSFDIRSGAVLVVAGLMAQGTTTISGIAHIDRGYEDLDGRLRALGADIERVT